MLLVTRSSDYGDQGRVSEGGLSHQRTMEQVPEGEAGVEVGVGCGAASTERIVGCPRQLPEVLDWNLSVHVTCPLQYPSFHYGGNGAAKGSRVRSATDSRMDCHSAEASLWQYRR